MKLVLTWNFSKARKRRRILGIVQISRPNQRKVLEISLSRLALVSLLAAVTGWLALGTVFYLRERANPYTDVAYSQIVFPWKWSEMLETRAQAHATAGRDAFLEGRFREALILLRASLQRVPSNIEARVTLAQIYALARRTDEAIKLLEAGIGKGVETSEEASELLISLYNSTLRHEEAVSAFEKIRDSGTATPAVQRSVAESEVNILYQLKEWTTLVQIANAHGVTFPDAPVFPIFEALALEKLDRKREADQVIESHPALSANPDGQRFARVFISMERPLDKPATLELRRLIDSPGIPATHKAEILTRLYEIKQTELAEAALLQAITIHQNDPRSLVTLANRVGGSMQVETAEILLETVIARDATLGPAVVGVLFEATTEHEAVERFGSIYGQWESRLQTSPFFGIIAWARPLIDYLDSGGKTNRELLLNNLSRNPPQPEALVALIGLFLSQRDKELATQVAEIASSQYPRHPEILEIYANLTETEMMKNLAEMENL